MGLFPTENACELARLRGDLDEYRRLARAIKDAAGDEARDQAVCELIQHANGNGWLDLPEPTALLLVRRAEAAEARVKELEAELARGAEEVDYTPPAYSVPGERFYLVKEPTHESQ